MTFNFDQKIGEKIKCVDLILADYGAILFDTIYLKDDFVKLRKGTKFEHDLIYNKSLDISLRKDIKNFEIDTSEKEILKQIDELIVNISDQYLHNLKTKYFGKKLH